MCEIIYSCELQRVHIKFDYNNCLRTLTTYRLTSSVLPLSSFFLLPPILSFVSPPLPSVSCKNAQMVSKIKHQNSNHFISQFLKVITNYYLHCYNTKLNSVILLQYSVIIFVTTTCTLAYI